MTCSTIFIRSASRQVQVQGQVQRWFSAAAAAPATASASASPLETKLIPTRHSRHGPPPACLSSVQLIEVTQEVLETSPGLLIHYKPSARDDSFYAWQVADHSVQKVEWLIRGYSAKIKNTIMNNVYSVSPDEDPSQNIVKIQELMRKIEKEGKLYMDLRQKMRSQLAVEAGRDQDYEEDESQANNSDTPVFASPGLTVSMIDTLFDSMAVTSDANTPSQVGDVFKIVNERFMLDGGMEFNTNPSTIPTQLTINAGLRAIANSPNVSEKTRDDAIVHSFTTFDALRDSHLKRNSATYSYMIQTISKFIPPSEMAGNIAHAMWLFAKEDQVIDTNIMKALETVDAGNYLKFQTFLQENIRDKTTHDIPHAWRKFAKSQRYNSSYDTY